MSQDANVILLATLIVLMLFLVSFPQYGMLIGAFLVGKIRKVFVNDENMTTVQRSVEYISSGIIFLSTPLPDTETLGIPFELCEEATPGDLIEITLDQKKVISAKILEVREHIDTSGTI